MSSAPLDLAAQFVQALQQQQQPELTSACRAGCKGALGAQKLSPVENFDLK